MPKSISKTKDKLTQQWLQQNGIIGENKWSSHGYIHGQTFLYSGILASCESHNIRYIGKV